jgi:glycosyltransferase involved in cell wall biosynthesis
MSNKKVYLPVIAYGGACRAEYSMSVAGLFVRCLQDHPDVSFLSTGILFESLVSRARNSAAAATLHYGTDYLLFIDADISFDPKDVFKLLGHDKDVVCGAYAKKYYNSQKIAFLAKNNPEAFATDSWKELATDYATELNDTVAAKIASSNGLVEVDYAATGFMLIKANVFKKIIQEMPSIKYRNEVDGYMSWGDNFYDFFPAHINQENGKYESEDYGFCNLWRSLGGKIHLDPTIKLHHIGNNSYGGDLVEQVKVF